MSYRPENQSIEDPCRAILSGIEDFECAVNERVGSGDWKNSHIAEIVDLAKELSFLKYRFMQLAEETW